MSEMLQHHGAEAPPSLFLQDPEGRIDHDAGYFLNGAADPAGPDPQCLGTPWKIRRLRSGLGAGAAPAPSELALPKARVILATRGSAEKLAPGRLCGALAAIRSLDRSCSQGPGT